MTRILMEADACNKRSWLPTGLDYLRISESKSALTPKLPTSAGSTTRLCEVMVL